MALRSLARKLRGLLPSRATASRTAASDLDLVFGSLRIENPVDAKLLALSRTLKEKARIRNQEIDKLIRKNYRSAGLYAVTSVGCAALFWSSAVEALADDSKPTEVEKAMDAVESKAIDAKEVKAMDAED
ncbi:hypothetical protein EJB05_14678 [Eragrostis curvula]|uniref:Uncharacterized protein n=1 Tax=Eragrostis curvula TaxID=38414 RepID=A0A5J9VY51_9POAL|nr:hypothetical protein EJB05_14678 [Eragrostis curvula]